MSPLGEGGDLPHRTDPICSTEVSRAAALFPMPSLLVLFGQARVGDDDLAGGLPRQQVYKVDQRTRSGRQTLSTTLTGSGA